LRNGNIDEEGNVETEPRRIVCEDVGWIKLTEGFIQQLVLVLILSRTGA
jgi:hypothetical protein